MGNLDAYKTGTKGRTVWKRECPICKKIIKGGVAGLSSFEDIFKRHLSTHKLYAQDSN